MIRTIRPRGRARPDDSGWRAAGVAVEFALVLPVVLALLIGLIESGRLIWTYSVIQYAVQTAARCAAVDAIRCATSPQIQAYAVEHAVGLALAPSAVTVDSPACGVRVRVTMPFMSVAPGLVPYDITLSAEACYPD